MSKRKLLGWYVSNKAVWFDMGNGWKTSAKKFQHRKHAFRYAMKMGSGTKVEKHMRKNNGKRSIKTWEVL